ncbi:hypothetical protein [Paraburkholderia lycopersici]|uniref:DNA transfer protein p32 n=1 Tax=Paraburkholderia lycopersici TaxID=416944 RepID=A0A1G6K367_9BURK|nr:hypothetical protein [Paraburkholderia lycopersici]SDC25450.1 hypothetical protein SAMN05421548_10584 [Paraburkholderia lycopersici]
MSFGITAAVVGGVGSIVGGVIGGNASKSAAETQANAANYAADLQKQAIDQERQDLQPFTNLGTSSINPLLSALGYNVTQNDDGTYTFNGTNASNPLQQTFNYAGFTAPTAAEAAATPGYQFTLQNGLKAAQNSASARGLGSSGAALKGASAYATGLADSTYNDVYNRDLSTYTTNRNNAANNFATNYSSASDNANRLLGLVNLGQNSAAMQGATGVSGSNSVANTLTSGAAAQAAGTVGSANAITGGLSSALNGGTNALLLNSLLGKGATATDAWGSSYGAVNANNPSGYNIGSNQYGFTAG